MAPRAGNDEPSSVLYGFHTVTEALQSPTRAIERLWLAKSDGRFFPLTRLAKERHIPFSVESRERLDRLAGDRHHQGVVAIVAAKQFLEGEDLLDEVAQLASLSHLQIQGLMTIPPPTPTPEAARPFYQALRDLRDRLARQGIENQDFSELSMGMTADFEVAIEEGATLVRVGTAIFGPRPTSPADQAESDEHGDD